MRIVWLGALALAVFGSALGVAQEAAETGRVLRESTEFEQMRPTLMLLAMAGSCVISLIALVLAIKKESRAAEREQVKEVEARISAVEKQMRLAEDASEGRDAEQTREIRGVHDRVAKIETQIKHLPDKDTVQRLAVAVAHMEGDVKSIARGLESVDAATTRIEDFLLKKAAQ